MAIAVVSAIIGRRRRKKESYIYWQPSCPLCRDTPQWLQTRHTHFGLRRNIIYLSFNTSVIHVEAAAARFKEKKTFRVATFIIIRASFIAESNRLARSGCWKAGKEENGPKRIAITRRICIEDMGPVEKVSVRILITTTAVERISRISSGFFSHLSGRIAQLIRERSTP